MKKLFQKLLAKLVKKAIVNCHRKVNSFANES